MKLLERFPDVYRYVASEATPVRLIAGFVTANILCFCILLAIRESKPDDVWRKLFEVVKWLQVAPLLIYGTLRAAGSIFQERADRTWDFQRLTPLSSFEITFGKILGAPVFPYFLFFVMLPWALLAAWLTPGIQGVGLLYEYRVPVATVFFTLTGGLLVSAHSIEGAQGRFVNTAGTVFGLFGLMQIVAMAGVRHYGSYNQVLLYGLPLTWTALHSVTMLVFGLWAFAGSTWRVGDELLEPRKFWRFPLFLLFLCSYVLGIEDPKAHAHAMKPDLLAWYYCGAVVFVAALLRPERTDYWRRWLSRRRERTWLDEMPVWVAGYGTALALALLLAALNPHRPEVSRPLVLGACFLGRDLAFLQWCRFTRSRRPTMMALVYIGLAYSVPPMLLSAFDHGYLMYWFAPITLIQQQSWSYVVPGLLQALLMGWLMLKRLGRPAPESAP